MLELDAPAGGARPTTHRGARLWLRLVGEFEAHLENGDSVLPVSKKARALLALVAAHMPQPVRREFAASLLWSGKPRDHAGNSLRQALRELQISLTACGEPPILLTGSGRLTLQSDSVWIDIHDPSVIAWKPPGNGTVGPLLLCQNLQGLDPSFDAHLERLWKNLVFQQAFVVQPGQGATGNSADFPIEGDAAGDGQAGSRGGLAPIGALEASAFTSTSIVFSEQSDRARQVQKPDDASGHGWRIAVLPFRSLGSPLDGGLSLGMAEEISAALSRFRMPRLIATGSFWDGSGPATDALARCRAFSLDYVISGTIQTSGQRIRVTVTLLDVAMDFEVVWASRFEGTTQDLFTLQDKIASQTVAQIDPELLQRHHIRGDAIQTANAVAHHSVLTAIQGIYRPDKPRFMQARDQLLNAISLDEDYAAAHAWLAYWYLTGISHGWIDDPHEAISRAGVAAERAIVLDALDARGVTIAGHVKAYLFHDIDAALALHRRATNLNPNLPIAWTLSSWSHIYNGDHQTAMNHATMAESLSPTDPHVFVVEHAAMTARFFLGDLEIAEALASNVLERRPRHATALKVRLAILGHLGRTEDAAQCLAALRTVMQDVTVDRIIARPPLQARDRAFYVAGLRLAGVAD